MWAVFVDYVVFCYIELDCMIDCILVSRLYCLGMLCLVGKTSIVFIHFDNQHTKHERTNKQFMYMYSVVNHADNFHNLVFIRKHINAI